MRWKLTNSHAHYHIEVLVLSQDFTKYYMSMLIYTSYISVAVTLVYTGNFKDLN